jgi:hypothetical protein
MSQSQKEKKDADAVKGEGAPDSMTFSSKLMAYNRILAATVVLQVLATKNAGKLGLEVAPQKIFSSFEEFYPFYLSQHADPTCQRLHIIGTSTIIVLSLMSGFPFNNVSCLVPAMVIGCAAGILTTSLPHGIAEAVVLLATYLFTVRATGGKASKAVMFILIGYAFAWVGHFYFEMNRPATFIYPTYSLMGDFKMWYEVVSNQRPF